MYIMKHFNTNSKVFVDYTVRNWSLRRERCRRLLDMDEIFLKSKIN